MAGKPLFPVLEGGLFPVVTDNNSQSTTTDNAWLKNISYKVKPPSPPPPPPPNNQPTTTSTTTTPSEPFTLRRPRAIDYFEVKPDPEISESIPKIPIAVPPSEIRADEDDEEDFRIFPKEFDMTLTKPLTEDDEDRINESSEDSEFERRRRKKKKLQKKRKKKNSKSDHPNDTQKQSPTISDDRKKRKTDKEKMLEANMKQIKEDPRSAIDLIWQDEEKSDKDVFYMDDSGDKNNIQFGHLYQPDIPRFRRIKQCLGVPKNSFVKYDKNKINYKIIDKNSASKLIRYFYVSQKKRLIRSDDKYCRKIKPKISIEESIKSLDLNFIAFFEDSESDHSDSEDLEEKHYLERIKWYNEETRKDRSNIRLWLEYINFQDTLNKSEGKQLPQQGSHAATLEKKISIFEKALEVNPHSDELLLGYLFCLEQLYESSVVAEKWKEVITSHPDNPVLWKNYVDFFLSNFTTFSISGLRSVFSNAIRILNRQKNIYHEGHPKHYILEYRALMISLASCWIENQAGYAERAMGIFQGLLELNLNCPEKIQLDIPIEMLLDYLQTFWQSEAPRIGEPEALGWNRWQDQMQVEVSEKLRNIVPDYDPEQPTVDGVEKEQFIEEQQDDDMDLHITSSEGVGKDGLKESKTGDSLVNEKKEEKIALEENLPDSVLNTKPLDEQDLATQMDEIKQNLKQWIEQEDSASNKYWLPTREVLEENGDTERIIFFNDIRGVLFQLSYQDLKFELVFMFLHFLGLNLPQRHCSNCDHSKELIERKQNFDEYHQIISSLNTLNLTDPNLLSQPPQQQSQEPKFYRPLELSFYTIKKIDDPIRVSLIRNILQTCTEKFKEKSQKTELQILRIYFEGVYDLATARTLAKDYLKLDSNNFLLWHSYANMELLSGNIKEARRVYDKALRAYASLSESLKKEIIILIRAFAELEFKNRNTNLSNWDIPIINILLTIPDGSFNPKQISDTFTKSRLLKARKVYSDEFNKQKEYLKNKKSPQIFSNFVYCYLLFEYITSNNLESAEQVYKTAISILHESSAKTIFGSDYLLQEEMLSVAYSSIVYIHSHSVNTTPPSVLRILLTDEISKQPMNICLLSMFIEHESKSKISGRLRLHFDIVCPKLGSSILWYFAIKSENQPGCGDRIKNLFERAIQDDSPTRRSALLWHQYLLFEISRKNLESAKKIYYRAIRSVPWYKPVWLECIRYLSNIFNSGELTDIIRLLYEKEIRLHIEP